MARVRAADRALDMSGRRGGAWTGVEAAVTAAAAASLVVLGAVVGLIGLLEATAFVRLGDLRLPAGAMLVGPANLAIGLLGVWGLRTREAAALPAIGWFAVLVVAVFGPHPGGDILLPGSGGDVAAFAIAGIVGTVLAAVLGRQAPRPAAQVPAAQVPPTPLPLAREPSPEPGPDR